MNTRERCARRICTQMKCDPDGESIGMGWTLPKDFKGKTWEGIALHLVDSLLDELTANPGSAVLKEGAGACDGYDRDYGNCPHVAYGFVAMIRAIMESK